MKFCFLRTRRVKKIIKKEIKNIKKKIEFVLKKIQDEQLTKSREKKRKVLIRVPIERK